MHNLLSKVVSGLRQNCFKHRENLKLPLFQREEGGLFTFHLMARGKLKAKK